MSTGKIYNFITFTLLFASGVMGVWLYLTWTKVREENAESRLDESKLIYRLNKLKQEKEYNTEYYYRLIHDEEFAERVIREKLGYAGKDEIVFRFKDSTPLTVNGSNPPPMPKIDAKETSEQKKSQETTLSEQPEVKPETSKQKSILRRLFSKDEAPKIEKEIVPQIRIDLRDNQNSENINQAKEEQKEQPELQKKFEEFKSISIEEQTSIPQPQKKKSSKKRKKNSIRFRAN